MWWFWMLGEAVLAGAQCRWVGEWQLELVALDGGPLARKVEIWSGGKCVVILSDVPVGRRGGLSN